MANDGAVARLSGRFPPGTKVGLYRNRIDGVNRDPGLGDAFKTATVDKNGEVEFSGLDDDERLFVGAEVEESRPAGGGRWSTSSQWRVVGIHASVPKSTPRARSEREIREALAGTLSPDQRMPDRTTVGARGSRSLSASGQPFAHPATGKPTEGGAPSEPVPHLRQEDARNVDQRSATFTGQATPVDPSEQVPRVKQVEGIDLEQRSATALGELTPIPRGEVVPGVPADEDAKLEQRSATPRGVLTPVPTGDPVEHERRRDSSEAKAEGAVIPPVERAAKKASKPRARSQKRKPSSVRSEAQKAARRKRDAARRAAKRKGAK